jgi:Glycosyl hydrolase family 47
LYIFPYFHIAATMNHTSTNSGYTTVSEVNLINPPMTDFQPAYFFSETLKYYYLLFSENPAHKVDLTNNVFTTEAHLLHVFDEPNQFVPSPPSSSDLKLIALLTLSILVVLGFIGILINARRGAQSAQALHTSSRENHVPMFEVMPDDAFGTSTQQDPYSNEYDSDDDDVGHRSLLYREV